MSVAVASVGLRASVSTCRVTTAAPICSQTIVNRSAVCMSIAWGEIVCVAMARVCLRASVCACRV